jgi:CDP-diacylglycerol--glycerol-3-phosphate 3-phosphatidyltransferase
LANYITASRIVFAGLLVWAEPFSVYFWVWYICGGISDIIDGSVARRLHQQSETGAKLDSAADFLFILCAGFAVFRSIVVPVWALAGMGVIVIGRFASYGVGYWKYHTFAAFHTLLNKAAGALLIAFPVFYCLLGIGAACGIVGGVALIAAAEELILMIRSRTLDRDRKSLFILRDQSGK